MAVEVKRGRRKRMKRGRRKRMKIMFRKLMKLQTYTVVMKVACCWIISLCCLYLVCELFKNRHCATANNCGWSSSVLLRYTIVSETRYAPSATPAAVCCYLKMLTLLLCSEFLPNHWCSCALRVTVKIVHNEDNRAGTLFVPIEVHPICLRFLSVTGDHGIMGKTSAAMALLSTNELHGPDASLSACLYVKCCEVQC